MSSEGDRRAPGATRIPFEALVEVGTTLGPPFEAEAVDVSGDGMHLRTAYLPEVGQPLTCRFDAGHDGTITAQGEVVWQEEMGRGGEFGLRFTDLDQESERALGRIVGVKGNEIAPQAPGSKVRLHIEGLGFPMRARIKDASQKKLTVGNELGFLQVGKELELEDAETGAKRPARIDRVEVEIDQESKIPRLVVGLRYADEEESVPMTMDAMDAEAPRDSTPEPSVMDGGMDDVEVPAAAEQAPLDMRGAIARGAAKVTPALLTFANRAKVTAAVLWAKRKRAASAAEPVRRTTAPPPAGALTSSGRKVVRGEVGPVAVTASKLSWKKLDTRRKIAAGAAAGLAATLAFAALHHTSAPPPVAPAPLHAAAAVAPPPVETAAPLPTQLAAATPPPPVAAPVFDDPPPERHHHHSKPVHVTPFGYGTVHHGNVLKLHMDGPIERINGATLPTGFAVSVPGRRSLEPAGPLAARDARIASIKVTNDHGGAVLNVSFKDGVPSYLVRAHHDILEILLAPIGRAKTAEHARSSGHGKTTTHHAPSHHRSRHHTHHKK